MKKQLMIMIMVLGGIVVADRSLAQAQIVGRLKADIPFSFYAGGKHFSAGAYTVTMKDLGAGLMEIRRDDGTSSAFFLTEDRQAKSDPASSELIFNKYGETIFLSRVIEEGSRDGAQAFKSTLEKRIERGEDVEKLAIALR